MTATANNQDPERFGLDVPPGSVVITTTQMYDELRAVHHIVTDTRSALDRIVDSVSDTRADVTDHETRIRALERSRWAIGGAAAALGAALSQVIQALGKG